MGRGAGSSSWACGATGAAGRPPATPDSAFAGDGIQVIDCGSGPDLANDVLVQPDGKIVTAGTTGGLSDWTSWSRG